MKLEERLIIAVDFNPKDFGGSRFEVWRNVQAFLKKVHGTGVYVKFNSFLRAFGYDLIDIVHEYDLKMLADLKLIDIPKTLELDGVFLRESKPEMVTVMCCAGVEGMSWLKRELPNTEVLGVTVLTSLKDPECKEIFTCTAEEGVLRFAHMANDANFDGLILSPHEAGIIRSGTELQLSLNTPGIRPEWAFVEGDDQSRVMTPYKAILGGADRIVVGRPIMQASNPMEAIVRTLEEIDCAIEDRM